MKHINNFELFNEGRFFNRKGKKNKEGDLLKDIKILINKTLKKHLLKKYEFEYGVVIWTSKHSNYDESDKYNFEIVDFKPEISYDYKSDKVKGIYIDIILVDKEGEKFYIMITDDSPIDGFINLEYAKPWDKKPYGDGANMYSAQILDRVDLDKIDYDDPSRYPNRSNNYDLVPSKYDTIEMIKDVKEIINMINENVK